jgi:hypothetical protein
MRRGGVNKREDTRLRGITVSHGTCSIIRRRKREKRRQEKTGVEERIAASR